ncbi:MAG: HAMP domain-containing histidine kinase, partial [Chlorobi bacterium]|nr:HAMP domain-containing histidine kinase [Chlorobiota bacterium]
SINYHFDSGDTSVTGDPNQMQQVFVNLLVNAIQTISPRTGMIQLCTFRPEEGGTLFVDVEDNGPGISEKNKEHIFEPFFTTKRSGGTGLGLSTAKNIVKAHGGDLVLLHNEPGKTIFRVIIPESPEMVAEGPGDGLDAMRAGGNEITKSN